MKPWGTTVQMKAIEHFFYYAAQGYSYFQVCTRILSLFYTLDKVVLTFKSVTHQIKTVKAIGQFRSSVNVPLVCMNDIIS